MGISVCAFSAKAAPRKHQARISRPMHVGRFTQEPAETCPLTHSPRVLSIGPAASTVVRISRAPRSVHDCRPGQSDWMTSETGSVVIGSAPARSAAVRCSYCFLSRPGGRFFQNKFLALEGQMCSTFRASQTEITANRYAPHSFSCTWQGDSTPATNLRSHYETTKQKHCTDSKPDGPFHCRRCVGAHRHDPASSRSDSRLVQYRRGRQPGGFAGWGDRSALHHHGQLRFHVLGCLRPYRGFPDQPWRA